MSDWVLFVRRIKVIRTKKASKWLLWQDKMPPAKISVTLFASVYRQVDGCETSDLVTGKTEQRQELQLIGNQIMLAEQAQKGCLRPRFIYDYLRI